VPPATAIRSACFLSAFDQPLSFTGSRRLGLLFREGSAFGRGGGGTLFPSGRAHLAAVLQAIADNPDWTKIYAVRRALVENALTPIVASLRLLTSLTYQHLQALAKNKGIPGVIAIQARRLAANHQKFRE
jgi:hypothetical protein